MNKFFKIGALAVIGCFMSTGVSAGVIDSITTSASASGDGSFSTDYSYGYSFTIEQHDADLSIYHATLSNTSDTVSPEALIDAFAFNMNADLGVDFAITNVLPSDWEILDSTGGVQFNYVGTDTSTGSPTRLGTGDSLTFDFDFDTAQAASNFSFWLGSSESCGSGFGGGGDCGQVAVSFQQLGTLGQDSDLLASNWEGGGCTSNCVSVPEPASIALMGLGLLGMGATARRRKKS